jgi:hypothetical protein
LLALQPTGFPTVLSKPDRLLSQYPAFQVSPCAVVAAFVSGDRPGINPPSWLGSLPVSGRSFVPRGYVAANFARCVCSVATFFMGLVPYVGINSTRQPCRPSPCSRLSLPQSTTAAPPQGWSSTPALSIPVGSDVPWFPGSDRRLYPLTLGGTTAYVAYATLRPVLLGWWSPCSTPKGGASYDRKVGGCCVSSARQGNSAKTTLLA